MSHDDKSKSPKKETQTISFRLDAYHLKLLDEEAEKHNISVHEQARRMLIDRLTHHEAETILARLTALQAEAGRIAAVETSIADLRTDLAEAVDWIIKKLQRG